LQGLREQGELIKKENEGKKKLELAYISNEIFFCEQVKVIVFSNIGERATSYIQQAAKQ
jgi:predicted Fe-Mo cluster-binding NifX family protein